MQNSEPGAGSTNRAAPELREMEQRVQVLEREKQELVLTLDGLREGLVSTDREWKIVRFNAAAAHLTGWKSAEAIGRPLWQVLRLSQAKTGAAISDLLAEGLQAGASAELPADTMLSALDGTHRLIAGNIALIREQEGQVLGAVLVLRDITRLRQDEEKLKEAQAFARSLIDSSPDMIIASDRQRRIIEFNPAAQETFGYTLEEILGQDPNVLYAKSQEGPKMHWRTLEKGRYTQEVLNRRKDGTVFPSLVSTSLLKDASGRVIGVMGVSRDISPLKQAEEQMIRSERMTTLGRLAVSLAHEINLPLQAIRSTLDGVLEPNLKTGERERSLRIIRQEIERLSEVTARILSFAQPTPVLRHLIPVDELVQEALDLPREQLQHAHIQVTTDYQFIPPILAAPDQLVQVFLNLVLNAIEVLEERGRLHISTRVEDGNAAIAFMNDGPTIPPETLAHIFEPFFTMRDVGRGIGLYISQMLVQQQGGTLTAENLPDGRGVVFTVRLPLSKPETEPLA